MLGKLCFTGSIDLLIDFFVSINVNISSIDCLIISTVVVSGTCYAAAPLITRAEFVAAVTWASPDKPGFPAPTDEQYFNILARAANGKITTKAELAMFLANVLQESGGLRYKKELNPPAGAYSNPPLDVPGKQYYGRGYLQVQLGPKIAEIFN